MAKLNLKERDSGEGDISATECLDALIEGYVWTFFFVWNFVNSIGRTLATI